MAVNPLSSPPTPQNSNMDRSMFVWISSVGAASDPLSSDTKQNNLLSFCSTNGVNVIFLDMYRYLGAGNWSAANRDTVKKFTSVAHQSGIRVFALIGDVDWGHNMSWVAPNIIKRIAEFNVNGPASQTGTTSYEGGGFDGVMLDVEYWTVGGYSASVEVPGLCDLMSGMKKVLDIPVGCFTTQWLMDTGSAQTFTYKGVSQVEGKHIMDNSDHVVVACYNNTGSNQVTMFQPWYNHASQSGYNYGLWCGSEVGSGLGTLSYSGSLKSYMETQHTTISNAFVTGSNMVFRGQAINPYSAYSVMP